MDNFSRLVNYFISTDQLGDYDLLDYSITLYGIPNQVDVIQKIHQDIRKITSKYKLVVTDLKEEFTNIKILDIDL